MCNSFALSYLVLFDILIWTRQVDWNKASTDFKPSGKPIAAASFKTSVQRMFKDKSGECRTTNTQISKRKASSEGARDDNRKKKSKTARDNDTVRLSPNGDEEKDGEEDLTLAGSKIGSLSPLIKDDDNNDDDAHLDDKLLPE